MPRRKRLQDPRVPFGSIRVKKSLHDAVQLLLLDPMTGQIQRGKLNTLIEELLEKWLDSQRVRRQQENQA